MKYSVLLSSIRGVAMDFILAKKRESSRHPRRAEVDSTPHLARHLSLAPILFFSRLFLSFSRRLFSLLALALLAEPPHLLLGDDVVLHRDGGDGVGKDAGDETADDDGASGVAPRLSGLGGRACGLEGSSRRHGGGDGALGERGDRDAELEGAAESTYNEATKRTTQQPRTFDASVSLREIAIKFGPR